jgi:hypothetical protein
MESRTSRKDVRSLMLRAITCNLFPLIDSSCVSLCQFFALLLLLLLIQKSLTDDDDDCSRNSLHSA